MGAVVAVGHCNIDYLGVVGRYPEIDRKEELRAFSIQGGGPAATAAATLATLGVETRFVGKLSDDDFGVFARRSLEDVGVDCQHLVVVPDKVSPMSFIAVDESTGRRTIFWTRGDVGRLTPDEVDPAVLDGAEILLVDGHHPEAQLHLALEARKRGLAVLLDAGSLRDGMEELVKVSTVVVASERFSAELAGSADRAVHATLAMGPKAVVITLGEDGAVGRTGEDSYVVAPFVTDVKDTTGAGDVYHGAFAYGMLQKWPLRQAMEFADCAAGLKCRELGGRAGIPGLEEILAAQRGEI